MPWSITATRPRGRVVDRLDLRARSTRRRDRPAGEMVRVVRVQALHTRARAGRRRRTTRAPPASSRVVRARTPGARPRAPRRRRSSDPGTLVELRRSRRRASSARDRTDRLRTREPVHRRERGAVSVERRVADHERMPGGAARDDGERRRGIATELFANGHEVGRAQLVGLGSWTRSGSCGTVGHLRLCSTARL